VQVVIIAEVSKQADYSEACREARVGSRFCCWLCEVGLLQHFLQSRKLPRTARKAFAGRMLCRPTLKLTANLELLTVTLPHCNIAARRIRGASAFRPQFAIFVVAVVQA